MSDLDDAVRDKLLHPVTDEPMESLIVKGLEYVWMAHLHVYALNSEYEKGIRVLRKYELIHSTFGFEQKWTAEKRIEMLRSLANDGYEKNIGSMLAIIHYSSSQLERSQLPAIQNLVEVNEKRATPQVNR